MELMSKDIKKREREPGKAIKLVTKQSYSVGNDEHEDLDRPLEIAVLNDIGWRERGRAHGSSLEVGSADLDSSKSKELSEQRCCGMLTMHSGL